MRIWVALALFAARAATAEPLPAGSIGFVGGGVAGTGPDARRLGAGYYFVDTDFFLPIVVGMQASWQPTTTERRWGWTVRWSTMFGRMYAGTAAQIETLRTVQMDATLGVRVRPWATPQRYLTARAGGELFRANEPIPPTMARAFVGGIVEAGLDQYAAGFLLSFDVRYGLIGGNGPNEIALLIGIGRAGP